MECYEDLSEAIEQCDRLSSHVQRLRHAIVVNGGGNGQHIATQYSEQKSRTPVRLHGSRTDYPLPPLSDTMFKIANDMEALVDTMKVKLSTDLRSSVNGMSRDLAALQQTVMSSFQDASNESAANTSSLSTPAAAPNASAEDVSLMMSILSNIAAEESQNGSRSRGQLSPAVQRRSAADASLKRRQSWVHHRTAPLGGADEHDTPAAFQPIASPIIIKQMDRWRSERERSDKHSAEGMRSSQVADPSRGGPRLSVGDHDDLVDGPLELLPTASVEASPRTRPPSGGSSKRTVQPTTSTLHGMFSGSTTSTAQPTNRPSSGGQLSRWSSQRRPTSASGHSLDGLAHTVNFPPFPYANTPFPEEVNVASWWHRVIHQLQEGTGSTVLTIDGHSIGQDTANVMLSEVSTEPPCLSSLVSTVMTMRPESTALYLVERVPKGSDEASWRTHAMAGQTERIARGSPILASRKSKLLAEKLQFAADRPVVPGLLETLYADTRRADVGRNLWVRGDYRTITSLAKDALIRNGVAESWSVVPPPRGRPVTYFATSGTGLVAMPPSLVGQSREETPRGSTPQASGSPHRSPSPFDGIGSLSVVHHDACEDSEFIVIDCFPHILCPMSYAVCSTHPFHAGECPRNWVFEGSADHGTTWVTLRTHVNDASIGQGCDFAVFDIPPIPSARANPFASTTIFPSMELKGEGSMRGNDTSIDAPSRFCGSMFRIRLTGPNAAGTTSLQVGALELYGRALVRGQIRNVDPSAQPEDDPTEDITSAAVFGCGDPVVPSFVTQLLNRGPTVPFGPLPQPPVAAKGKKGKK
jgi:hypothetical protein